jgi:hypothetical protein
MGCVSLSIHTVVFFELSLPVRLQKTLVKKLAAPMWLAMWVCTYELILNTYTCLHSVGAIWHAGSQFRTFTDTRGCLPLGCVDQVRLVNRYRRNLHVTSRCSGQS